MGDSGDLYEVLGVPRSASAQELDAAYRSLVRKTHPDAGGTEHLFRLVQEAYETLSDPVRRTEYDRSDLTPRDDRPGPSPTDSGWVRVGQPPNVPGDSYPPPPPPEPPHSGPYAGPPPAGGHPPGWRPPPTFQTAPGRADQPPVYNGAGGGPRRFIYARPWIVPVAVGFLIIFLGRSLAVLGLLVLLVGLVAATGSRRARVRFVHRSAGVGQADFMDGTTFEHFSAEVLRSNGYQVEHVGQVADYGADLIISNQSGRAVVQVKRYSGSVGVDAVREAAAARAHYGTHRAIVLTNSYFTPHAINLARSNAVDLWDRNVLVSLAGRNLALPPASVPTVFLAELVSGLAIIGRVFISFLGAGMAAGAASSSRRRTPARRRRRRR